MATSTVVLNVITLGLVRKVASPSSNNEQLECLTPTDLQSAQTKEGRILPGWSVGGEKR